MSRRLTFIFVFLALANSATSHALGKHRPHGSPPVPMPNTAPSPAPISAPAHRTDLESALDCSLNSGALPDPNYPEGVLHPSIPLEHIVVIMQENHSFDAYFGKLNSPRFYGSELDGLQAGMRNPDRAGKPVRAYHESNLCIEDTDHTWNAIHAAWNGGKNDGFVKLNGTRAMGYYTEYDLPYYYALADEFAVADRYFCSALTQTFPNRFFLLAGTAFGHVKNDSPRTSADFAQRTIFDVLTEHGISWKYYTDGEGYLALFRPMYERNRAHMARLADYHDDLKKGTLPQLTFLDSVGFKEDEHPRANVQIGQAWVAAQVRALMESPAWESSALFLTYDENGALFDHVAPPAACAPDGIAPLLPAGGANGAFDRLGFRVPFVAVSPYAKHHFVSHVIYDHTSILKFIETRYNLPALTRRDANADAMLDLFDFDHPRPALPALPSAEIDLHRPCK